MLGTDEDSETDDEDGSREERYTGQVYEQEPYCKNETENRSRIDDHVQQLESDHRERLHKVPGERSDKDRQINNLMSGCDRQQNVSVRR